MHTFLIIALAATFSVQAPSPLKKFGWFADLIGSCWVGTFPDGKTQHSQCYTSQFDAFIRGTATLSGDHNGKWTERFSGDSVFAFNQSNGRIEYYIWGSDGNHAKHEAFYDGDELLFPVNSRKEPGKIAFRSVRRRLDRDSFEVRREVPDGARWKTALKVLYRKSGAAK